MEMLHKHDLLSGQYTGLQSRLMAAHVLNLILVDTCSKNATARDFFGTLYDFFQPAQSVIQYL